MLVSRCGAYGRRTLNPEAQSSCLDRLGMPPRGYHAGADDDQRLEAQDELRAAVRAMGYMACPAGSRLKSPATSGA
jgi:hypothetical protein